VIDVERFLARREARAYMWHMLPGSGGRRHGGNVSDVDGLRALQTADVLDVRRRAQSEAERGAPTCGSWTFRNVPLAGR